jgi:ubiquinone/menaquinone biosynthesis C-methylase UbiE
MHDEKRWTEAQNYEKDWWDARKKLVYFDFYKKFADELIEEGKGVFEISPEHSILEIGSGAGGILTYLNAKNRDAIDPLEDFYSSVPEFVKQRDPEVKYLKAKAESLPYDDLSFDLIICDNVIDHCDDADKVFSEMKRVLKDSGNIYLRLNTYTAWGRFVRLIVELLKIDPGHPYTFTPVSIRESFKKNDLELVKTKSPGFLKSWLNDFKSLRPKGLLKAIAMSSPDKAYYILKKK